MNSQKQTQRRVATHTPALFIPGGKPALRRAAAFLSSAALLALAGAAPSLPAAAGPDDGKIVTTKGHVDAPKAYWDEQNGTFVLMNEANPYKTGADTYELDKTVNWVGKGYSGRDGKSQYTMTLGDSPSLAFLGEPGQTLYMAPHLTSGNQDPIWAGLGASAKIPTERFRDGVFVTDVLSVEGPGRMELFRYNPDDAPADVYRMLSSSSTGWHSWLLDKGSHTHNTTTFTRPGRYVVTYRTVARSTDGRIISSKPSKLVWQVGGMQPVLGDGTPTAVPTVDRYNAAPVGDLDAAKYVLSVAPHRLDADLAKNKDADDKLSDITFTAANKNLKGTLTLYNNGYFLTDLPVVSGTATWSEMLGSEGSQLQAVFTPDTSDANSAEASRWISHKLAYEPGKAESVYSDDGNGSWPEEIPDEANTVLSTQQYTPTSMDYDVTVTPNGNGFSTVEVRFKDPKVRGFLRGGFYAQDDPVYPYLDLEGSVEDGVVRFTFRDESFYKGTALRVKMLTHPDMNASASTTEVAANYEPGTKYTAHGALAPDSAPISDAPKPAPVDPSPSAEPTVAPSAEPSNEPSIAPTTSPSEVPSVPAVPSEPAPSSPTPANPTPSAPAPTSPAPSAQPSTPGTPGHQCVPGKIDGRTKISHGHLDIQATLKDRQLSVGLRDDSGIIDADSTVRPLDSVVWTVSENARRVRTERMADEKLNFMGPVGTAFYGLPQTQQSGLPWPGYNTQDIDYSQLRDPVRLHVVPKVMPEGARFGMFTESLNGADVLLDSTTGKTTIDIDYATHAHANWVFSEPGQYMFDVHYSATLADGTEVNSPVQQLAVAVGKKASDACSFETAVPKDPNAAADDFSGVRRVDSATPGGTAGANQPGSAQSGAAQAGQSGQAGASGAAGDVNAQGSADGSAGGVYPGGISGGGTGGGSLGQSGVSAASGGVSSQQGGLARTGFGAVSVAVGGALVLGAGTVMVLRSRRRAS
ncbi:choice-of-anchor M domain-containing protein [Rothia mucilaginosa]|uniref:choice-of-anchor M domain-containing protein n=1 Tax=Rothia mucilaginosa TaxID=43675 RepID=UPI00195CD9DC|nr:choice-of-anchor M domain-containing protein [Rothia mucilaginosa]VTY06902.1 anch_rpt_wall: putative ABC transporter-associated repeat protein [Rothia mucilaginosa]